VRTDARIARELVSGEILDGAVIQVDVRDGELVVADDNTGADAREPVMA
jgi:hypothetical protein